MSTIKPKLGERTTHLFWDDSHISSQMLAAHLSFENDLASRKKDTIVKSVEFMIKTLQLKSGMKILDLGCGPGLYTEEFAKRGFEVTGIDYSKRSINYAIESAKKNKLSIEYIDKSYLDLDFVNQFDLITLIYFDYGALVDCERAILDPKISRALKENGHFVFDSYTDEYFKELKEDQVITEFPKGGFWSNESYQEIKERILYPEEKTDLTCYRIRIGENEKRYHVWNRSFSLAEVKDKFSIHSLFLEKHYSDLMGNMDNSQTMALFLNKKSYA